MTWWAAGRRDPPGAQQPLDASARAKPPSRSEPYALSGRPVIHVHHVEDL
ncbi:MAG: hypothetical protein R2745_20275 [Vicinamibacterales bacterium]